MLRKPNHYQTWQKFVEFWILSKLAHGNAYILKERDDGAGVVEEQSGVLGRPVEAPRVGVPPVECRQKGVPGRGVERLGRGGVEVAGPRSHACNVPGPLPSNGAVLPLMFDVSVNLLRERLQR